MEVSEAIAARRSVRKFFPKPIEVELVGDLIAAGVRAPSVGDLQPWKFIVVSKAKQLQAIADSCPYERWLYQAPLIIIVCSMHDKAEMFYPGKGKLWADQSCAAAAQNMLLAAVDLGLGGCWVTSFETEKLREVLHIPGGVEPAAMIAFGYPDEEPQKKRLEPFDANIFWNDYGQNAVDRDLYKKDFGIYFRGKLDDVKTAAAYATEERGSVRTAIDRAQDSLRGVLARFGGKGKAARSEQNPSRGHEHEHDHTHGKH